MPRSGASIRCRLAAGLAVLLAGCSVLPAALKPPESSVDGSSADHARFVQNNLAALNRVYSRSYEPCRFIVDTDSGSTPIQNLIDLEAARRILQDFDFEHKSDSARAQTLLAYLRRNYRYVPEPQAWVPVAETIRRRSGDCKNQSLLLLSLLTAGGLEAYGAISNGHMWVMVLTADRWQVLETDPDGSRNKIYRLPGFYSDPLFRIYPGYSLKRRKIDRRS